MPDNQEIKDIQTIRRIFNSSYKDSFFGQFFANATLSRLTQERSLAANKYLDDPTAENWAHVQRLGEAVNIHSTMGSAALDDVFAVAPVVSKEFAQYLPKAYEKEKTNCSMALHFLPQER